tara:strand:- start:35221 stop:36462 length:1242 start_codon:yes stop_codon:yes gene_type:complete
MSILIKKATIVDTTSKYHLKKMDILIDKGQIVSIQKNISSTSKKVIKGTSLHVSSGWMDMHAEFNDPGFEYKEDLKSGANAAKNGGFTTVVVSANNYPVTDSKSQINYVQSVQNLPVEIKSLATLSEGLKGQNFSELYDLHLAGAVGFSDGHAPIENPDLLKRSLLYCNSFNGKVIVYPSDKRISHGGMMHEGKMSTSLGLKSDPSLSEEIMVARDLSVAEYCDAPIHFMTISTAGAVAQIKRAKKRGVRVTCDVAIANLIWNDTALAEFDSNFKTTPPLRSESDRKALINGVKDGTIDCIVTNHSPQNIELKKCEFDLAEFGQSSIETAFSLYNTHLSHQIDVETWVKSVSVNPRAIFGSIVNSINENEKANLTVFDTSSEWIVKASDLESKSKNSPVIGQTLNGRVISVIC